MTARGLLLGACGILVPAIAVGQEVGLDRLDELGFATAPPPGVECPTDVDWPPLPREGRQVFRTGRLNFEIGKPFPDEPLRLESVSPDPDPDVRIPQYGYFLSPRSPAGVEHVPCRPVILVRAERSGAIGWISLEPGGPKGGSYREYFIPIGTKPPR